jgi:signal transduction histidine kinase
VILAQVILAAPDGVLRGRAERITMLACYAAVLITQGLRVLTEDPLQPQGWGDPQGEISIWAPIGSLAAIVGVSAVIVLIIRRWRGESPALRRARGWYWPAVVLVGVDAAAQGIGGLLRVAPEVAGVLLGGYALAVVFLGMTVAVNAIRLQLGHRHISLLVAQMQAGSDHNGWLRDAIARSLADPTLTLHYRRDGSEDYVDCDGNAAPLPVAGPNRAMTCVGPEHAPVAVLVHDPFLARHPRQREKLQAVAAAAGLAIRNVRSAHGDAGMSTMEMLARRKIGADLHDGPQYRLTALKLMIGQARATASAEDQDLLRRLDGMVQAAVRDLREVAQGVYPSTLRSYGLAQALDELAGSSPVPVVIDDGCAPEPLPERVAETAYFLVSEAVGNAIRHAGADLITIRLRTREGALVATVADNGSGRARMKPAGGGVRGMHDRAAALDGSFDLRSEPGEGTTVTVRLPCV